MHPLLQLSLHIHQGQLIQDKSILLFGLALYSPGIKTHYYLSLI